MMFQVMIFRWLGLHDFVNVILLFLILLSFLKNRFLSFRHTVAILLCVFGIYQVLNFLVLGGTIRLLMRSGYRTVKSVVFIVYLSFLAYKKRDFCTEFLRKNFWLFNIYMLINIPVLLLQLNGHYSLAAFYDMGPISLYFPQDLMSGLLGRYGTPCLAFYAVFIALYNYIYGRFWINKRYKKIFTIYNVFLLVFNLAMSTQNDNKGHYIVFAFMVIQMYLYLQEAQIIKRFGALKNAIFKIIAQMILIGVIVSLLVFVLYKISPEFRENIADLLLRKINEGLSQGKDVHGGGERLGMIVFMISTPSKLLLGHGLGNYSPTAYSLGFPHFGLADFGTYLCLGGIVYMFILFLIVYKSFGQNIRTNLNIIALITIIVFSIYTQIFSNTSTTICMMFIYWVCWIANDFEKSNNCAKE